MPTNNSTPTHTPEVTGMKLEFSPKSKAAELETAWNEAWKLVPPTSRRVMKRYVEEEFKNRTLKVRLVKNSDVSDFDLFPYDGRVPYEALDIETNYWKALPDKSEPMLMAMAFLVLFGTGLIKVFGLGVDERAPWIYDGDTTKDPGSRSNVEILARIWRGEKMNTTANVAKMVAMVMADLYEMKAVFSEVVSDAPADNAQAAAGQPRR